MHPNAGQLDNKCFLGQVDLRRGRAPLLTAGIYEAEVCTRPPPCGGIGLGPEGKFWGIRQRTGRPHAPTANSRMSSSAVIIAILAMKKRLADLS